jgi:hypothetical protein
MEEDQEFLQDSVKVVLHVQAQKGWDAVAGLAGSGLELVPLTRPYGLQPGIAFQAQVLADGKPLLDPAPELAAAEAPRPVRLALPPGAKELTLAVEFGRGGDVQDHVDWADARLIK